MYITVSKLAAVGGPQVDTCRNRPEPAGSAANAAAGHTHTHAQQRHVNERSCSHAKANVDPTKRK